MFGGVLVSTGIYDLLAACGGFLVTSLIIPGKTLNADYGYAAAA
jgi:energy-converting hydrogenase Eha subunit B